MPPMADPMDDSDPLQNRLLRWSEGNAAAMVAAAWATATGSPMWLLSACGLVSFSLLVYGGRHRWTPSGRFGAANVVTLLRLCGVLALPWLAPRLIVWWGLILFALDGADGWIARRTGLAAEFGESFDKESDAFFTLMLCVLLYRLPGGFGAWILVPGLLRYLFVLFVKFAKPRESKEQRTAKAGWIFCLMTLTLLFSFAAYPGHLDSWRPMAVVMTLVLVYSFAESLRLMYRGPRRRAQG
jgi:phosphatidylglycerophosphate synthase